MVDRIRAILARLWRRRQMAKRRTVPGDMKKPSSVLSGPGAFNIGNMLRLDR